MIDNRLRPCYDNISGGENLAILCVEDDTTTRLLYHAIFEDLSCTIFFANDGLEALELFASHKPDIIITDYQMPKMDGLEFIEKVRKQDREIPILLVSAIEDINVVVKAIELNVSSFIQKPIEPHVVVERLEKVAAQLIATRYMEMQQKKRLQHLEAKERYLTLQEDLAFSKELNILRNDYYYQLADEGRQTLIDLLYKPLDILSGDAYSVRRISRAATFYLIVDGMGKGLSASLSSILLTAFINHTIDKMLQQGEFELNRLIQESLEYIRPILLDEEAVAVDFILFDDSLEQIEYAKFAMPAMLLQNKDRTIIRVKSNNPPLSKYSQSFTLSYCSIRDIKKILFFSDGLVENTTLCENTLYAKYIEEDFASSFTKSEFREKVFKKFIKSEDDITFIFINRLDLIVELIEERRFSSSLDALDEANEWYAQTLSSLSTNTKAIYNASLVFTELFMNAFEHGNLALSSKEKHALLESDGYIERLIQLQNGCDKEITVKIEKVLYGDALYTITKISDEGDGFDTNILSEIFRNAHSFNGRGVFVSRKSSLGIYYNAKGNSVLYLHKIS